MSTLKAPLTREEIEHIRDDILCHPQQFGLNEVIQASSRLIADLARARGLLLRGHDESGPQHLCYSDCRACTYLREAGEIE